MQKEANRVVEVRYPPGKDSKTGKSNQELALSTGDLVRSGATVAIPSETYVTVGMDGEERQSSIQKWAMQFLEGAGSFDKFHEMEDHHDKKMSMGFFLPPQALLNVTGGQLGSVTSAEALGDIAQELLMQDSADIDRHVNKYVFPAIGRANFPPDSPRVIVETVGLDPDNSVALLEVIKALIGQSPDVEYFDMRGAMERLEFPLKSEEQVAKEKAEAKKTEEVKAKQETEKAKAQLEQAQAQQQAGPQEGQPSEVTPPEQVRAIGAAVDEAGRVLVGGKPLKPWPEDRDVPLGAQDADTAVAWWEAFAPEGAKGLLGAVTDESLSSYDDNATEEDNA